MYRIEQVDFEKCLVANMVSIKGYSFHNSNMRHEYGLLTVEIPTIADTKRMVNRYSKAMNVDLDYIRVSKALRIILGIECTIFRTQASVVLDVEVREYAMYVGTDLLACLCRTKYPDDRHLWRSLLLRRAITSRKLWIKLGRICLIMVHTVHPDAKEVHRTPDGTTT